MQQFDAIIMIVSWAVALVILIPNGKLFPMLPLDYRGFLWKSWLALTGYNNLSRIPLYWHQFNIVEMVMIALPFAAVAGWLTMRRLKTLQINPRLGLLVIVPFANLFVWLLISMIKEPRVEAAPPESKSASQRAESKVKSFGSATALVTLIAVLSCVLSINVLKTYGAALFVMIPFIIGTVSVMIYGQNVSRGFWQCQTVMASCMVCICAALVACAIEGIFCIAMAVPLAICVGFLGATLGYYFQPAGRIKVNSQGLLFCTPLFIPGVMALELITQPPPPTQEISTSLTIHAPVKRVWKALCSDSLIVPDPALSIMGINEPLRWSWKGQGLTAMRRCDYALGGRIQEPIQEWDPPRSMRFSVVRLPAAMKETSPYNNLQPLHVENHYIVNWGEFRLASVPGGTILTATTNYSHNVWPTEYWTVWSDQIMHQVHLATLKNIQSDCEKPDNVGDGRND